MRLGAIGGTIRDIGVFPILLVLLLVVRVGAAPAVQCQHELAALASEQAAQAEGADHHLHGHDTDPAAPDETDHSGHLLTTPCPFFKAPVVMPDCGVSASLIDLVYTRNNTKPDVLTFHSGHIALGYNPRAPPRLG